MHLDNSSQLSSIIFITSSFGMLVKRDITSSDTSMYPSGQTKQKLKKRLDQHRNDSKPKNAQKTNTTALAEHHFKTGHIFKFDETKILDKEDNWKHQLRGTSSVRKVMVG
ncbi:hypothetical protein M0804_011852 [Polistes exclamans]|nr:hypothetical protein M0804_011852 [Polistes exclamans]